MCIAIGTDKYGVCSTEIRAERAKWRATEDAQAPPKRRIKELGSRDEPAFASSDMAMHPRGH